jgi:FAD dependent oxidoreductase TIGR03364
MNPSDTIAPDVDARRDWDVIVVGAGVLGAFHAYFALKRGLRTLLIERNPLPLDASVRNFGMITPGGMAEGVWHERAVRSARVYRGLAGEFEFGLNTHGSQYLATTPVELEVVREFARLAPARGYECRLLDPAESVGLNPALRQEVCLGSVHFPGDVRFNPRRFLPEFIPWMARSLGCDYLPGTVVREVARDGGGCRVVAADGTARRAAHVFVCGGADVSTLFPREFAAGRLTQCKLHMFKTEPQRRARITASIASGLTLRRYPAFRMCPSWQRLSEEKVDPELVRRGIHVLLVQDADGGVVIGDSHEYKPQGLDERLDSTTEALILAEAQRLARLDDWRVAQRWHGIYLLDPEHELFRRTIDERIHLVSGIGGKGMTTGPGVASESMEALGASSLREGA